MYTICICYLYHTHILCIPYTYTNTNITSYYSFIHHYLYRTEEELAALRAKAKAEKSAVIEELVTRRTGKREHEYEVIWEGQLKENTWHTRTELVEMGYQKMVNQKDEQIAMESMLGQRKLTTGEIQKHFDGFGLEPQFAQHTRMGALSGGQKVKVVLGQL